MYEHRKQPLAKPIIFYQRVLKNILFALLVMIVCLIIGITGYHYTEGIIYHTVASDLSDLKEVFYDILAFFSPSGINSLLVNHRGARIFRNDHRRLAVRPRLRR